MESGVRFVTFTGRPGSGKSTIIKRVLAANPNILVFHGRSVTTRPKRDGDVPYEYEHVGKEEFAKKEEQKEFLWTIEHNSYRFGTKRKDVENALKFDTVSALTLVPDTVKILRGFVGHKRVISFFISAEEEELYRRLTRIRRDSGEFAKNRLEETKKWEWAPLVHNLGVPFFLIKNEEEDSQATTATAMVLSILKSHNL